MKLLHTIETAPNPNAVCSLSASSENCYMVYPSAAPVSSGLSIGSGVGGAGIGITGNGGAGGAGGATAVTSPNRTGELKIFDCISLQPVNVIEAHKGPLSVVTLNNDGTLLATASDKGTIIRIFAVPSGQKLYQFRRGTYPSKIFSINFNLNSTLLCVSSATETVHIFKLSTKSGAKVLAQGSNPQPGLPTGYSNNSADGTTSVSEGSNANSTSSSASVDGPGDSSITREDDDSDGDLGTGGVSGDGLSSEPVGPVRSESQGRFSGTAAMGFIRKQSISKHVAGYLPNAVSNILEPKTRDFAYFKLPAPPGVKSVVAFSNSSTHALVVTSEGYFYQYAIDLDNGGECELVKQFSLLDSEEY
ncbi:phosphoinositide binding protein ATG18 [Sugiyamaella lignohabitans]|uniref:Phosphoinositide binding protein ATG18 n=1 Tax=Sugiyamaella lignohabitans TaxID=796027 RepID=A0A167DD30_9ASCO|nr:phosphoinositide binding protein ATG18 [Sugiyamaella lignohabitans]ANB12780.1 phosphoinositide binding protein ATG18 [Sugiyamaella lignohabitans]